MHNLPKQIKLSETLIGDKPNIALGLHLLQIRWEFAEAGEGKEKRVRIADWLTDEEKETISRISAKSGQSASRVISSALLLAKSAKKIRAA